jgi:hypothetical protein
MLENVPVMAWTTIRSDKSAAAARTEDSDPAWGLQHPPAVRAAGR